MNHYTINTGHNRVSPRSEVKDDIVALLQPFLEPGEYDFETIHLSGFRLEVPICEHGYYATIFQGEQVPVTSIAVADTQEAADEVWPGLFAMIPGAPALKKPLGLPWCAVGVLSPFAGGISWLGDFERCLAWAWLESRA